MNVMITDYNPFLHDFKCFYSMSWRQSKLILTLLRSGRVKLLCQIPIDKFSHFQPYFKTELK